MKTLLLIALGIAAAGMLAAVIATKAKAKQKGKASVKAKRLATEHEQKMFWRLIEAFQAPEKLVFAQVSFGALLTATEGTPRGFFDKKIADFVVTTNSFAVLAVIELDDASHKGKKEADDNRDAMLQSAGYKTLRYKSIPSVERLRADVAGANPTQIPIARK